MRLDVENQIDRSLLETEFERSNIKNQFFQVESDVLGKSSKVEGTVGYFEISREDFSVAREIYDNIRQTRIEDTISVEKQNGVITVPRISVSLLILSLCGIISFLLYDNSRLEKLSHHAENISDYTRKWNSDKTVLSRYFKDTGILEAEYTDGNFNGQWEEETFYEKKGKLRSHDFSSRDNGVFDSYLYYNPEGILVQKSHNSEVTLRNAILDVAVDDKYYYEFSEVLDGTTYYAVKKISGQIK